MMRAKWRTLVLGGAIMTLNGCGADLSGTNPSQSHALPANARAKASDLLYVAGDTSTGTGNVVFMLTYPQAQIVGKITGFSGEPNVLCVGKAGDVFVTQIGGGSELGYVFGYHHGDTAPFIRLHNPGNPDGCSVDPSTGDLAVADYLGPSRHGNVGNIAIYREARGVPTVYRLKGVEFIDSCSYDGMGDLVADGYSHKGFTLLLLPRGSSQLTAVPLDKSVDKGGPIQWDGKDFVLGYARPRRLYRVAIVGSQAHVLHALYLDYKDFTLYSQFWIEGKAILGIMGPRRGYSGYLGFWPYPAGGKATTVQQIDDTKFLTGVAVSLASSR
jgi:hypothetical protein